MTCCVLHNLLLDYDGLDNADDMEVSYNILEQAGEECARRSNYSRGIAGMQSTNCEEYGQEINVDDNNDNESGSKGHMHYI